MLPRKLDSSLLECLVLYLKLTDYSHLCLFALERMAHDEDNCKEMLCRNLHVVLLHEFNYIYKFNPDAPWLGLLLRTLQRMVGFKDEERAYEGPTQQVMGLTYMLLHRRIFLK